MDEIKITPSYSIPAFLIGEVQAKLAYVDEDIQHAEVSQAGDQIVLTLRQRADERRQAELNEKVQKRVLKD